MMCTTVLHGCVCHPTSTPHKSWIKMKENNNNNNNDEFVYFCYIAVNLAIHVVGTIHTMVRQRVTFCTNSAQITLFARSVSSPHAKSKSKHTRHIILKIS